MFNVEMFGTNPFYTDDNLCLRKATLACVGEIAQLAKEEGIDPTIAKGLGLLFDSRRGLPIGVIAFGEPKPWLAGQFDTVILQEQFYETVKRSLMEQKKRDTSRSFKHSGYDPTRRPDYR